MYGLFGPEPRREMKQTIVMHKQLTLDELRREVEAGARFVVFQYCYSIVAVTVPRLSPAFLITDQAPISTFKRKYNLVSGLLGWWAVPWGPVVTVRSWLNNRKGLDVTNDIMLNITEESLAAGEVPIERCHDIFAEPTKSEMKTLRKTIVSALEGSGRVEQIIVAFYVNTDATPHLTVGIEYDGDFARLTESMRQNLRKHYHERVRFDFLDLSEGSDLGTRLIEQGASLLGDLPAARALPV